MDFQCDIMFGSVWFFFMLDAAEMNLGLKNDQNLGLCCDVILDFMRNLIGQLNLLI